MKKYINYAQEIAKSIFRGHFSLTIKHCPMCGKKCLFLISGVESRSIRCLNCRSTAISLATISAIIKIAPDPDSFVYELSYHGAVFSYLRKQFKNFEFSEFFGPPSGGEIINGIRNEDVQKLSFNSAVFDLVTSTEVFEHVPNYISGFSEIYRVLKNNGYFIFTVPLFDERSTISICEIRKNGVLNWLGREEYHDSRVTGVGSVPVFWHHSRYQVISDLKSVGFAQAQIMKSCDYSSSVYQYVIVARK
jgi:SAM-dependent methyltransferase